MPVAPSPHRPRRHFFLSLDSPDPVAPLPKNPAPPRSALSSRRRGGHGEGGAPTIRTSTRSPTCSPVRNLSPHPPFPLLLEPNPNLIPVCSRQHGRVLEHLLQRRPRRPPLRTRLAARWRSSSAPSPSHGGAAGSIGGAAAGAPS